MNNSVYITVSDLNHLIKDKFDQDPSLNDVFLKGELSNVKLYSSGHLYFSVKDSESIIKGVMWGTYVNRLNFKPKDGDEVILHGKVSCYPARGEYQIYVDGMALNGAGDELRKLKELAEKLRKEGLFDDSRKRKLPKYPKSVGVITAKGSAAIEDMKVNLLNRWPLINIEVFPSLVQGADAPKDLINALEKASLSNIDVLIIGRGGGSSEDLGAFNDEELVRKLANFKVPTISAVGHEIDVTLTDLVADLRVSTPTGAAIAAVPDKNEILTKIDDYYQRLSNSLRNSLSFTSNRLSVLANNKFLVNPSSIYEDKVSYLKEREKELYHLISSYIGLKEERINGIANRLKALSPNNVLNRGYSFAVSEDGKIIKSINDVKKNSTIKTTLKDGIIVSRVEEKEDLK